MSIQTTNALSNTYRQNQILADSSTTVSTLNLSQRYLCKPHSNSNINITLTDFALSNSANEGRNVDFSSSYGTGTTTILPQSGTIDGLSSFKLGKGDYARVQILDKDDSGTLVYSLTELKLSPVEFNVINSVNTAIPAGVVTVVPFDTVVWNEGEVYDGTDTLDFQGYPGFINLSCQLTFSSPVTGSPISLYVYKNGSNVKQVFNQIGAIQSTISIDYSDYSNGLSTAKYQIRVFQNQTGSADLNILSANLIGRRTSVG